ncbi:hypothetical protein INR49_032099 [Caranx melampygus]|nr:hypothetical protein INR49_032099 [Caranx melampygus]
METGVCIGCISTGVQAQTVHLEGFGDSGLGGFVDLSLPDTSTAALPQLTQTEAQVLLIGIVFNLQ